MCLKTPLDGADSLKMILVIRREFNFSIDAKLVDIPKLTNKELNPSLIISI